MHRRSDAPPSRPRARSLADLSLSRRARRPRRAAALAVSRRIPLQMQCSFYPGAAVCPGRTYTRSKCVWIGKRASPRVKFDSLGSTFPSPFLKKRSRGMRIVLLFSTFDIQVTFPFPSPLSIPHTRPTEATI